MHACLASKWFMSVNIVATVILELGTKKKVSLKLFTNGCLLGRES